MNPRMPLSNQSREDLRMPKQKISKTHADKLYESKSQFGMSSAKNAKSLPSKEVVVEDPDKNSQKVKDYIVE